MLLLLLLLAGCKWRRRRQFCGVEAFPYNTTPLQLPSQCHRRFIPLSHLQQKLCQLRMQRGLLFLHLWVTKHRDEAAGSAVALSLPLHCFCPVASTKALREAVGQLVIMITINEKMLRRLLCRDTMMHATRHNGRVAGCCGGRNGSSPITLQQSRIETEGIK